MSSMSDYLEDALINLTLRAQAFTAPATLYLALFTADPSEAAGNANEVDAAWYARKATGSWSAPSGGVSSNDAAITFNAVTGSAVTVTHVGIYDALTSGNRLYQAPLLQSKTLDVGDVMSFAIGAITVTMQ